MSIQDIYTQDIHTTHLPPRRLYSPGLADMPEYFKRFAVNQTMHLKTNGTGSTGTIKIIIIPPALEAAMPSSVEQAEEFLSRMPPPPPMFLGK